MTRGPSAYSVILYTGALVLYAMGLYGMVGRTGAYEDLMHVTKTQAALTQQLWNEYHRLRISMEQLHWYLVLLQDRHDR